MHQFDLLYMPLDSLYVACEQGKGREEKGEKEREKERGACRNTPIFRLQPLYNLCGIIN